MNLYRQSAFLSTLLICLLLITSSTHQGHCRELREPGIGTKIDKYRDAAVQLDAGTGKLRREMIDQIMDYDEPGANTNPKYGFLKTPPPAPPPF